MGLMPCLQLQDHVSPHLSTMILIKRVYSVWIVQVATDTLIVRQLFIVCIQTENPPLDLNCV